MARLVAPLALLGLLALVLAASIMMIVVREGRGGDRQIDRGGGLGAPLLRDDDAAEAQHFGGCVTRRSV